MTLYTILFFLSIFGSMVVVAYVPIFRYLALTSYSEPPTVIARAFVIFSGRAALGSLFRILLSLFPAAATLAVFWYLGVLGYVFGSAESRLPSDRPALVKISWADLKKDQRLGYRYNGSIIEANVLFVDHQRDGEPWSYVADEDEILVVADNDVAGGSNRLVKVKVTNAVDLDDAFHRRHYYAQSSVLSVPRQYLRSVPLSRGRSKLTNGVSTTTASRIDTP